MNREDLIWCAGIIDADGSIYITKLSPGPRRKRTTYVGKIYVGNTSKKMVDEFREIFGGSVTLDSRKDLPNSKPFWHWNAGPKLSREILKAVLPFLKIKNRQAEIILEFSKFSKLSKKRAVKRDSLGRVTGSSVEYNSEILKQMEELYDEIKSLNQRGV